MIINKINIEKYNILSLYILILAIFIDIICVFLWTVYNLIKIFLSFNFKVFKGIYNIVKSMKGWKAKLSFFISFMILEGWAFLFLILGTVLKNSKMITIGTGTILLWMGPGTPLLLLIIAFALIIQKVMLRDKSITWENIKTQFKIAFKKEEK